MKTGYQTETYYRLTCAETAKLVRDALKAAFPGVKFSVRSKTYSGGASIDVSWTDGPTSKQVQKITNQYEGASFDGMIDLKSYKDAVNLNGRQVKMGADFIFENRLHSVAFVTEMARRVSTRYGEPMPEVKVSCGDAYVERSGKSLFNGYHDTLGDLVAQEMQETSAYPVIQPAKQQEPVPSDEELACAAEARQAEKVQRDAERGCCINCYNGDHDICDGEGCHCQQCQPAQSKSFYSEFVTSLTEAPSHAAEMAASIKLAEEEAPELPEPVYLPSVAEALEKLDEARTMYDAVLFSQNDKALAIASRNLEQAVTALQIALRTSAA